MAGNARFELSSVSGSLEDSNFIGNYSNGQRASYPGSTLDRSGSFREGGESRMFVSGTSTLRGGGTTLLTGDLPPISQCLMLDQLSMGDQKYMRLGELRRALGHTFGSTAENNSFGAAHSKPTPPIVTEELKRLKTNVLDSCSKAKVRAKKFDESLHKLDKYCDFLSKKQQRNELLANERSGGLNLLKMGTQSHRNPPEHGTQRLEDRTKNVVMNKRVRTSVAETRGEGRNNVLSKQPIVMGKDRDTLKDCGADSDLVEEKIRRLPAGEGWDKKMKRKRSVGTVLMRPVDNDGDLKRVLHHKLSNQPGLQSSDLHCARSGSYNASSIKLDSNSLPANSNVRATPENEVEKACLSRDLMAGLNKERPVTKGNNKSNIREENNIAIRSPVTKAKASRALRTGLVVAANSSSNFSRACGALEGWEQPQSVSKVSLMSGANNRKRPMPSGSPSPTMAQWGVQRQKISRTRRSNMVSPVSNPDKVQTSSDACLPADFGARVSSCGANGSLLARSACNGNPQFKVKLENVASPARLSESEESDVGENRLKEKGICSAEIDEKMLNSVQNVASPVVSLKKNKNCMKEEVGDGVGRQGRSGRGLLFPMASTSPVAEKLENPATVKPLRMPRPNSEKNGSKSGRPPLKKSSERKAVTRTTGHLTHSSSPDLTGESDDDLEELLTAAKLGCNASYSACSGSFWKKMEPIFAFVRMEDMAFLKQKQEGELLRDEISLSQNGSKELSSSLDMVDQLQDIDTLCGTLDSEMCTRVAPLYQRVLSALIVDDGTDTFEDISGRRNVTPHCARDDSSCDESLQVDVEPGKRNPSEFNYGYNFCRLEQKQCTVDKFTCNGDTGFYRTPSTHNSLCNDGLLQHSDVRIFYEYSQNCLNERQDLHADVSGISSLDGQYEQLPLDEKVLLELQSIGLYPETVPDLAEGDDEVIDVEIVKLKKELCREADKKKAHLNKLYNAIEGSEVVKERDLEQNAMDKLVELAYRKHMATRGSGAPKSGVNKVSRQVASAFVKRTLARCRKFEDSGKSCFTEPTLREALFAVPPRGNDAESTNSAGLSVSSNLHRGTHKSQCSFISRAESHDPNNDQINGGSIDAFKIVTSSSGQAFLKNGSIAGRGKKKEVLLDDVGGSANFRATSALGDTLLGGAKGKRSERDRDRDTLAKNSVAKTGRPSVNNFRGERKTKSKPKQHKTAQLSTPGNGFSSREIDATNPVYSTDGGSSELLISGSHRKQEVVLNPLGKFSNDSSKEAMDFTSLPLHELDSIEELGVAKDLDGNQDLSTWFNFEVDGLQDHDSVGLEIPLDDLSDLNMML